MQTVLSVPPFNQQYDVLQFGENQTFVRFIFFFFDFAVNLRKKPKKSWRIYVLDVKTSITAVQEMQSYDIYGGEVRALKEVFTLLYENFKFSFESCFAMFQ